MQFFVVACRWLSSHYKDNDHSYKSSKYVLEEDLAFIVQIR